MRKNSRFRVALNKRGVKSFDSYVQKFSPKLRKMKQKEVSEFLQNDQYNQDEQDTAKHWLSPLTG